MAEKSETQAISKPGHKPRSPNYPGVGLEEAVKRVKKLLDADGRAGSPVEAAAKHIGYSGPHGAALVVLSALKKFALLEEQKGRLAPTQLAIDIINFPEGHERRNQALRTAALSPTAYRLIVDQFKAVGQLPSDTTLRPELIADRGYTASKVDGFLKDFRGSLVYAGLLKDGKLQLSAADDDKPPADDGRSSPPPHPAPPAGKTASVTAVRVGDQVLWTSGGVDQFDEPCRVRLGER